MRQRVRKAVIKAKIVLGVIFSSAFSLLAILFVGALVLPTDPVTNSTSFPGWFILMVLVVPVAVGVIVYKCSSAKLDKKDVSNQKVLCDAGVRQHEESNSEPPPEHHVVAVESMCPAPKEEAPSDIEDIHQQNMIDIISSMENDFSDMYNFAYTHMLNAEDCHRAYRALTKKYDYSKLPLAAQIRLEQLCDEYEPKFENPNPMLYVDSMAGADFEQWCARLLLKGGFNSAEVTPVSGDQGVDIVAEKGGVRYAIQCKRYTSDLGNTPIQEVFAGKEMYGCQVGVVMTNAHFTSSAIELARKTRVLLWDREKIQEMIKAYDGT